MHSLSTAAWGRRVSLLAGLAGSLAGTSHAQIGWASYTQDPSRLVAAPGLGSADPEEKDYAWGDLDQDGWTDLVSVRKQPFTTSGRKVNVLFMNEGGSLVDRTAQYASATDVAGDNGFNTPTNDRDVVIVDVDLDGWLDVVTSTTISPGQPKHISHPRVYINLGDDAQGNWLGLLYQEARTPDFGTYPNFCGVAAGDVTGDGFPDLYFSHYEQSAEQDLDDRLLINDGTGYFTDESAARMTSGMRATSFGTSAVIMDMNGDGANDVVKDSSLGSTGGSGPRIDVIYNNPANVGFFNILQTAYEGAPYHVSAGDLNQDNKMDLVITDDGPDRYLLNQGNDGLGRVNWSSAFTYQVNDDGFGSNNLIVDLDEDGWNDVLIADVDVDIPGCDRRLHIYHNLGGQVGGSVSIKEESGGGSVGVTGISSTQERGTHDMAVFDLDNDGDLDFVFGRCGSTEIWTNDQNDPGIGINYCGPAVTNSSGQPGVISASGSDKISDADFHLIASQLPINQFGYFLTSKTQGFIANPGGSQGNLCLAGTIGRFTQQLQNSGAGGSFTIQVDLTQLPPPLNSAVLPGDVWNFTTWYRDKNPSNTSNFTDGLSVLFE